jgi:hypothetical protein
MGAGLGSDERAARPGRVAAPLDTPADLHQVSKERPERPSAGPAVRHGCMPTSTLGRHGTVRDGLHQGEPSPRGGHLAADLPVGRAVGQAQPAPHAPHEPLVVRSREECGRRGCRVAHSSAPVRRSARRQDAPGSASFTFPRGHEGGACPRSRWPRTSGNALARGLLATTARRRAPAPTPPIPEPARDDPPAPRGGASSPVRREANRLAGGTDARSASRRRRRGRLRGPPRTPGLSDRARVASARLAQTPPPPGRRWRPPPQGGATPAESPRGARTTGAFTRIERPSSSLSAGGRDKPPRHRIAKAAATRNSLRDRAQPERAGDHAGGAD